MGGREGLIDTAVKTSETGYLQRKLVKLSWDGLLEENEIFSGGKVVGVITSNLDGVGLGFVRNNFANLESELMCGEKSLHVTEVLSD